MQRWGELPDRPVALQANTGSFDSVVARFARDNFAHDDKGL